MCKVPMNISQTDEVEVNKVTNVESLSRNELENAKVVIISRSMLVEKIPQNIGIHFSHMESFIANVIGLKVVARSDFQNMKLLKTLNLADNNLMKIPHNTFHDLEKLQVLFLDGNKLKSFRPGLLNHMKELKFFSVQYNELQKLEDDTFLENTQLESIFLYHNKLSVVDVNFTHFKNIKFIDLRKNTEICTRCSPVILADRKLRVRNYQACATAKYLEAKQYHEQFENCTNVAIKTNADFVTRFENCTLNLANSRAELAKNNTKSVQAKKYDERVKQFSEFVFHRMTEENKMREQYENCIQNLISGNPEVENLLSNCTTVRDEFKLKVNEAFELCTLCKPEISEDERNQCNMHFPTISLKRFQDDVEKYFRSND